MALYGARASTSTVRIKLTCIEKTFQCLLEHKSILRPLTELNQARRSTLSPWMTTMNINHMFIRMLRVNMYTENPAELSALGLPMTLRGMKASTGAIRQS